MSALSQAGLVVLAVVMWLSIHIFSQMAMMERSKFFMFMSFVGAAALVGIGSLLGKGV